MQKAASGLLVNSFAQKKEVLTELQQRFGDFFYRVCFYFIIHSSTFIWRIPLCDTVGV